MRTTNGKDSEVTLDVPDSEVEDRQLLSEEDTAALPFIIDANMRTVNGKDSDITLDVPDSELEDRQLLSEEETAALPFIIDANMRTINGKDVTLDVPGSEVGGRRLISEDNTAAPLRMESVSIKVEVPELDFKNENEDDELESESFLFVDAPDAPFDETSIKMEPDLDESAIKQECTEDNAALLLEDDSAFAGIFIKNENMDEDDANAEENGGESDGADVYDFDDDSMETSQNENSAPMTRSASRASGRFQYDEERLYLCNYCPRKFREKTSLHQHVKTHPEEMHAQKKLYTCTYTCTMCVRTFPDLKRLNNHLKQHKVEKPYTCNLCPEKFRVKRDLKDHLELHTYTFACPRCPAKFSQESNLRTHVRIHHERPITAATITKSAINSASLVQAMKKNFQSFDLEVYTCSQCPARFRLQADLKDHLKVHTNSFQCSECPAKFTHRDNLHKHMKTHEEEPSSSTTADKSIPSSLVQEMKKNFQSAEPKPFPCQHCSESFKKESSLAEHLSLHFDSSTFQHKCKLCPAKFHKETTLAQHVILQHHDRKNLKCKLCNETFRLISHLKTHLKMCSREKPFSCIRCRATFHRKRDMRAHFKAMHPDTIFTCGHCYADFHKKRHLKEHLRNHDTTYPCPICPIIFNLEPNLKKHLKAHSEEESSSVGGGRPAVTKILEQKRNYLDDKASMLSCGHCSAKFKEKSDLSQHLKLHYIQPQPELPQETGLFFKSPFAKEPLPFSLAQEMKKNFANIKLRLSKPM